ncbi:ActS/PrrB/RegB family redox-sensitive histidine kinase [Pseudochrobactrum sp. HB0163]|uniref:ActS/PrrB/RegB family redox-sensitive histidine kinase n=1 Tax=Pseudochrobactrum sp. HB0163 TaxID=3450708 RepID=UPI003F6DECA9
MANGELINRASSQSRRLRLTTLVRVRWFAIAGQTAAILFVSLWLNFVFPLGISFALIAVSAWLNLFLVFRYNLNHRLGLHAVLLVLGFDIVQLTGLLFLTGGLQNPFAVLLVVPVIIAATALSVRSIILLGTMAIICASLLVLWHLPLPWYSGVTLELPLMFVLGVWCAIASTLIFSGLYVYRIAEEARLLGDALSATELVLQREQHLSALDGLAAAAAHELGTPLATITLVVKEMQRALKDDDRYFDDIQLLSSQARRCREILQRLTSLSSEGEEHMSKLALSSLIEEVIAPHRHFGIRIEVEKNTGQKSALPEPVVRRNPGVIYGLGNLIENAVDFARHETQVIWGWDEQSVYITIRDDGKGFSPDMLDRIGEPYMSRRSDERNGGGLGLGLFIAKTLLERSGAQITFNNRPEPGQTGAQISIVWPYQALIA